MNRRIRPIEAQLEAVEAQLGLVERGAVDPSGSGGRGLPAPTGATRRDDDPAASCVCALHGSAAERERFRG